MAQRPCWFLVQWFLVRSCRCKLTGESCAFIMSPWQADYTFCGLSCRIAFKLSFRLAASDLNSTQFRTQHGLIRLVGVYLGMFFCSRVTSAGSAARPSFFHIMFFHSFGFLAPCQANPHSFRRAPPYNRHSGFTLYVYGSAEDAVG